MHSRRKFLSLTLAGATATAGCVNSSDDGNEEGSDSMSEEDIENVVNQYQLEYDAHSDALNAFQNGISAYKTRNYELAAELFGNAEDFFQDADFRSLLPEIMGEKAATLIVEDAIEANNTAETVSSDCRTAAQALSIDGDQPSRKNTIANAEERASQGDLEVPVPSEVESAF